MDNTETLRSARNLLLKLHKSLIEHERAAFERLHGPLNAGQFLNVLIENQDFAWLRKFSTLIVEIDEMFDLDDGISKEMVDASLLKLRDLVEMTEDDDYFKAKYTAALQSDVDAAGLQAQIKAAIA